MLPQAQISEHAQRVQVEMEPHISGTRVKIRMERYDEGLGWYSSGCLTMPLHQLPLLEQAIQEMRTRAWEEPESKIIAFPGVQSLESESGA